MDEIYKIDKVVAAAEQVLKDYPGGMRFADLVRKVREVDPSLQNETGIAQYIQWMPRRNPEKFIKPGRGIFQLASYALANDFEAEVSDEEIEVLQQPVKEQTEKFSTEASFYQLFADYLTDDLDECDRATVIGGNILGGKWGTPDVIGITEPGVLDIYKPPVEIVSVEIKKNASELVVAFGQACSYLLFSHKSYIVVPKTANLSELGRLESLCQVFGIGLVLINSSDPEDPKFEIRMRALRREPETYYVNENLRTIAKKLFEK